MPAQGPSLGFEPRYVSYLISAWRKERFASLPLMDLQLLVSEYCERIFVDLTSIGLAEQDVKQPAIKSAIALLKSLKLAKQSVSGTKAAKVTTISVTSLGQEILSEVPAAGSVQCRLATLLVKQSFPLREMLREFDEIGPLSRPVVNPMPGTPRKGAAFNRDVLEGLAHIGAAGTTMSQSAGPSAPKPSAAQALKAAVAQATRRHPVSKITSLEKLLPLATELGLVWRDVEQVNRALGMERFGPAAIRYEDTFAPNVPDWSEIATRFADTLSQVYYARVDSAGFVTIDALRGGIGSELRLSAPVVDSFICRLREIGDHGEGQFSLQFEPNDDLLYSPARKPLIWRDHAFDFVSVRHISRVGATPSNVSGSHRGEESSRS